MGHHVITFRGRAIVLHDTWIEVLRGLIQRHARPTGEVQTAFDVFMEEWVSIGPGVFGGDAFDGFVVGEDADTRRQLLIAAITAARAEVAANGDELSVEFLNAIPRHPEHGSGEFQGSLASHKILDVLDKASDLLGGSHDVGP